MVNINKLKGKIVENDLSIEKLADLIGIDRSTLYRKIGNNGDSITIKEANLIAKELNLNPKEANDIFFSQYVAYNANNYQRSD
ncbi:MAG TPA: phage repressor protein [Clostridiales bacterium]|nr:phage repressor protein [Clostridiales bacterium]